MAWRRRLTNGTKTIFVPYLNYHRPSGFRSETVAKSGKVKHAYKADDYQIPYEKLKSLPNAKQYLRPGLTFAKLDKIAYIMDDNAAAEAAKKAKAKLCLRVNRSQEQIITSILQA